MECLKYVARNLYRWPNTREFQQTVRTGLQMHLHTGIRPNHLHLLLVATAREAHSANAHHYDSTTAAQSMGRYGRLRRPSPLGRHGRSVEARHEKPLRRTSSQRLLLQPFAAFACGERPATMVLREQQVQGGAGPVQRDV